jgi:LysM repeat protein
MVAKKLVGKHLSSATTAKSSYRNKPIRLTRQVPSKIIITQQLRPTKPKRIVPRHRFYTVKKGDTASSIAAAHNISVHKLCRVNNLGPKAVIRIGQNLKIPFHRSSNDEKANLQSSAEFGRFPAATEKRNVLHCLCQNFPAPLNNAPDDSAHFRIGIT